VKKGRIFGTPVKNHQASNGGSAEKRGGGDTIGQQQVSCIFSFFLFSFGLNNVPFPRRKKIPLMQHFVKLWWVMRMTIY
jgi:hypothetical protein